MLRWSFGKNLHRLAAEHERLMSADMPTKRARPRAIELAYDDTFRDACRALQVFQPPARLDWLARGAARG